jgi:tetratricopeptide (TPR) repeat protein
LNPGKSFADLAPGRALEEVFTTFIEMPAPFKVVSQSEQLAQSKCARANGEKLWCGDCHNPHQKPSEPAAFYRTRCLACHKTAFTAGHPPAASDCLPCHMPRRDASDGGHTAFTDHRISARPGGTDERAPSERRIAAWRDPAPEYRKRNLALGLLHAAVAEPSGPLLERSRGLLLEAQQAFPNDPALLTGVGTALQSRGEARRAAGFFERVIRLQPDDPLAEENAGLAWLEAGDKERAASHFERALHLDPLLLPDIDALAKIYRESGDSAREAALMSRVREAMRTRPEASSTGNRAPN